VDCHGRELFLSSQDFFENEKRGDETEREKMEYIKELYILHLLSYITAICSIYSISSLPEEMEEERKWSI
jgi:hypothetical protein